MQSIIIINTEPVTGDKYSVAGSRRNITHAAPTVRMPTAAAALSPAPAAILQLSATSPFYAIYSPRNLRGELFTLQNKESPKTKNLKKTIDKNTKCDIFIEKAMKRRVSS